MKDKVTIKIPRPLYEKLKKIIEGTGFRSVNEFVIYVLRDLLSIKEKDKEEIELTKEEIKKIKERLKNLGYF
ncbi:MAG: CopG family transcriptional regulator [candidate division WOR-3 bacterium]